MTLPVFVQIDCFVDASDNLHTNNHNDRQQNGQQSAGLSDVILQSEDLHLGTSGPGSSGPLDGTNEDRASLKVRLDETTEILRLALSNEFIKALELCEDR